MRIWVQGKLLADMQCANAGRAGVTGAYMSYGAVPSASEGMVRANILYVAPLLSVGLLDDGETRGIDRAAPRRPAEVEASEQPAPMIASI